MALVDLRLRKDETTPDRGIPLGWEANGRIVARIVVERDGDSLVLLSREGDAEDLLDALAGVATDAAAVVDEAGAVLRRVAPEAAPEATTSALTLGELETAVRAAWSRETAESPDAWSDANPAIEHCGVTALIVRELLGGEILVAGVVKDGRRTCRHAWNRLPSGLTIDLTREQFLDGESFEEPVAGEPLVDARYPDRYRLFRSRVLEAIGRS